MKIKQSRQIKLPALPFRLTRRTGIAAGAAAVVLIIVFFSLFSGCGVSHGSPKSVTKSLIEAYGKRSERLVKDCYGQRKQTESSLQTEIDTMMAYLDAHNTKDIHINKTDILWEDETDACVYILYGLVLESGQEYPCLGTYVAEKKGGKYYILPPSAIDGKISSRTAEAFTKFMTMDTYKDYTKEYNTFVRKNPGYEEKIATRMGE